LICVLFLNWVFIVYTSCVLGSCSSALLYEIDLFIYNFFLMKYPFVPLMYHVHVTEFCKD